MEKYKEEDNNGPGKSMGISAGGGERIQEKYVLLVSCRELGNGWCDKGRMKDSGGTGAAEWQKKKVLPIFHG